MKWSLQQKRLVDINLSIHTASQDAYQTFWQARQNQIRALQNYHFAANAFLNNETLSVLKTESSKSYVVISGFNIFDYADLAGDESKVNLRIYDSPENSEIELLAWQDVCREILSPVRTPKQIAQIYRVLKSKIPKHVAKKLFGRIISIDLMTELTGFSADQIKNQLSRIAGEHSTRTETAFIKQKREENLSPLSFSSEDILRKEQLID